MAVLYKTWCLTPAQKEFEHDGPFDGNQSRRARLKYYFIVNDADFINASSNNRHYK
ncbi:hypothetical protein [Salipaludibacillus neizhouensis]|uniref:hypothetical protein n=1 Tax=Salipaludibacillus neizhouensis TaxID=885475 RepID=UPI001601966D|nr:hypothetical protein [Salipaludibacillus neizhouensis]